METTKEIATKIYFGKIMVEKKQQKQQQSVEGEREKLLFFGSVTKEDLSRPPFFLKTYPDLTFFFFRVTKTVDR